MSLIKEQGMNPLSTLKVRRNPEIGHLEKPFSQSKERSDLSFQMSDQHFEAQSQSFPSLRRSDPIKTPPYGVYSNKLRIKTKA